MKKGDVTNKSGIPFCLAYIQCVHQITSLNLIDRKHQLVEFHTTVDTRYALILELITPLFGEFNTKGNVLVIGGTRMMGKHLARECLGAGTK